MSSVAILLINSAVVEVTPDLSGIKKWFKENTECSKFDVNGEDAKYNLDELIANAVEAGDIGESVTILNCNDLMEKGDYCATIAITEREVEDYPAPDESNY